MTFNQFLNWGWDPAATDPRQMRRVRTLVSACLLLILIGIPFIARAIQWDLPIRQAFLGTAVSFGLLALWLLRVQRFTLSVHSLAFGVYLGGLNQYLTVGGLESGAVAWWLIVPLIGGLLMGLRTGLVWIVIALLSSLILFYLETHGHTFPNLTPPEARNAQRVVLVVGEFLAVLILMTAYLTQIETSERNLAQKNASLQQQVARAESAEAAAVEASAAKTRFLANMTHELRTPLNSILGFSRRVSQQLDAQLNERQRDGLQLVVDNGEQMLRLVSDLLELSELEAGKLQLGRSAMNLRETVSLLLPDMQRKAGQFGLDVVADAPLPEVLIHGDLSRLKRALETLLRHAVQYCPQGVIRVSGQISGQAVAEQRWVMRVHCEQLCFNDEQLQRIFDRYDHLHSLSERPDLVSGLAMVLAREFVRRHGGDLQVSPHPQRGILYQLTLPCG